MAARNNNLNALNRNWEAIPSDYKGEAVKVKQTTDPYDLWLLTCFKANMACKQDLHE